MHGMQKIGEFWDHIPGYEWRQACHSCGGVETMEHILMGSEDGCEDDTARTIWETAKEVWPHEDTPWPEITFGLLLGCGSVTAPPPTHPGNGERQRTPPKKGATRLLQILLSESAHLIWVIRCERVIQEKIHTKDQIITRWLREINKRLIEDKIIATKIRHADTGAKQRVTHTWEDVLKKTQALPSRWLYIRKVLVGMRGRGTGRQNP
jgi:hypothetical protein